MSSGRGSRGRAGSGRTGSGRAGSGSRPGGAAETEDRSACTPCRGTGKLISSLNGSPHEVTCPWCGGSGRFQAGADAQQGPAADKPGTG